MEVTGINAIDIPVSKIRRRATNVPARRLPMKSNPYVGWFRHAPPAVSGRSARLGMNPAARAPSLTTISSKSFSSTSSLLHRKTSPYIGFFRHAPPSRISLSKRNYSGMNTTTMDRKEKRRITNQRQIVYVDGHLRGGNPTEHSDYNDQDDHTTHTSATLQLLVRLASWLVLPIVDDHPRRKKVCIEEDYSSLSSNNEALPLKNNSSSSCANNNSNNNPLGVSVSSLAEAYYAHQVVKGYTDDLSSSSNCMSPIYSEQDSNPHRLDYVITQMDIARMARNASRHLDVESILSLPTITYFPECNDTKPKTTPNDNDAASAAATTAEWSWMMVPQACDEGEAVREAPPQEKNDACVICLEQFQPGDRLRVLPCNHLFHMGCIDRWLLGTHSDERCVTSGCPICKKPPMNQQQQQEEEGSEVPLDGSVPSWAFARLGSILVQESFSE